MRLDAGSAADNTPFLYFNKGTNKDIVAQLTFINIHRHNNPDILPFFNIANSAFENLHITFYLVSLFSVKIG